MGEADFLGLFSRLNEPHSRCGERVERVLVLLKQLQSPASRRDAMNAVTVLRGLLRRYRWVYQVSPTLQGYRAIRVPAKRETLTDDDVWEHNAVRDLLDLLQQEGSLSRVRRCVVCNGWLFAAKRNDQEFCSRNCRQNRYDNDPKRKAEHRAKMRDLYALKKELARNPKAGVGLKTRRRG